MLAAAAREEFWRMRIDLPVPSLGWALPLVVAIGWCLWAVARPFLAVLRMGAALGRGSRAATEPHAPPPAEADPLGGRRFVVDGINEAQLLEFREAFAAFDRDKSGHIDKVELRQVLEAVGEIVTDEELSDMISLADSDNTGTIDFWEFSTLMAHKMKDPNPDRTLRAAFAAFDENGDGTLSAEELHTFMKHMGEPITDGDIGTFLKKVDLDGNGVIDYWEFSKFVMDEMKGDTGVQHDKAAASMNRAIRR